jgi:energy-coupling factor transporter transmembrane protein EcfT
MKNTNKYFVLSWILIPYVLFSFDTMKSTRYTMPILPAIALISSFSIFKIPWRHIRKFGVFLVLCVGFLQFFLFTYGIKPTGEFTTLDMDERMETGLLHAEYVNWQEEEVLKIINNYPEKPVLVVVIPDTPLSSAIMYLADIKKLQVQVKSPLTFISNYRSERADIDYDKLIEQAHFIFLNNKLEGRIDRVILPVHMAEKEFELFTRAFNDRIDDFELIKTITLNVQYNVILSIYKRKST